MPEILHIDLEGFFVAVERMDDPSLHDRPIVIGGQPTAWGCVVAASAEARVKGVRPGMSLSIAAVRCPDAVFLDGAVDRYLEASAAVDEILRDPTVAGAPSSRNVSLASAPVPVEWAAIDSVFLDLTGTASQLGPARGVAERCQQRIREELGFECACGIAGSRIAAELASKLSRPRGLLYVLPGYESRLLASLDVALLPDLPATTHMRLLQDGIATLGDLAQLDESRARGLIGSRGPSYLSWARGIDPRPVDGSQPPRSLAREVTLAVPIDDDGRLAAIVQHVTETLAARLQTMRWFAQTVTVRVRAARADDRTASVRTIPGSDPAARATGVRAESRALTLREATASEEDLRTAARALLAVVRRRRPLIGLGVVLSNLQLVGPQIPLFPLVKPQGRDAGATVRTQRGLRSLVEARYLRHRPRKAG